MNRDLLQAHIDSQNYNVLPSLKKDNSNINAFYCSDVVGNKRFAQNYGGYPRSEIAEINAAATMKEQAYLLAQLQDYSSDSNPNAGLTDAEIMLGHKSKYLQTASEQISWLENQIQIREQRRLAEKMKSETGNTIDFTEIQTPSDND